jgi:hypothetical protein
MTRIVTVILIYHRYKPIAHILFVLSEPGKQRGKLMYCAGNLT